ncbi:MAG: DUF2809 domain-containing protein [Flavobacteriaceae bacterium]|nr:DUF2809 domain-containing protein [Flavobacteriaceae bacterium]
MHIQKRYLFLFLLILGTEIGIALWSNHSFVRGFLGDVLSVILLYTFLKSFFKISVPKAILLCFSIAFLIEMAQFFGISEILNIQNTVIKTILGSTFDYFDFVAYSFGALLVFIFERNWNFKIS